MKVCQNNKLKKVLNVLSFFSAGTPTSKYAHSYMYHQLSRSGGSSRHPPLSRGAPLKLFHPRGATKPPKVSLPQLDPAKGWDKY